MARTVRDTNLETRNARRRLKVQGKPYWRALNQGLHLGYRKGARGCTWVVRRLNEAGRYEESRLALADDFQDADGLAILDYVQAQKAAQEWFQRAVRIEAGLEEVAVGNYTVADAMADYMRHYRVEGKAIAATQNTIDAHILPNLGQIELARLNTRKIVEWHKALAEKPAKTRTRSGAKQNIKKNPDADDVRRRRATANRILTVLKAGLNHAWREGRVTTDVSWRKVKPFKNVDMPVIRYLSTEECTRLINACDADFRWLVQAAILTAGRYGELTKLQVRDLNPDSGTIIVRDSKMGAARHIVLTNEAQKFFEQAVAGKQGDDLIFTHADGTLWGKSHQGRPLSEACKRARIVPAISFHILRHTHGSLLAMQGVPMPVIAKQLGHSGTRMTEKHYAHLSPSYVADTIRQAFPDLNLPTQNNVAKFKKKASN